MARQSRSRSKKKSAPPSRRGRAAAAETPRPDPQGLARLFRRRRRRGPVHAVLRWIRRTVFTVIVLSLLWIAALGYVNPPITPYMLAEKVRLGGIDQTWVSIEEISPQLARAAVAAEDANFCRHFGFEVAAIKAALEEGANRGGSTITQQVVKNVFLWHGRSWLRKGLEALITPAVEAFWTKQRILEVYLNIAEFDEGVFGAEAAARHYFDTGPDKLSGFQSALLAAVLPNPKARDAAHPNTALQRRANAIADGAATILADGRSACFEIAAD